MPADDLSGISGLDDRHRAVLAQKLGITTYYELIMADRQRIADAFGRRAIRPALEDVSAWQDEARRLRAASIGASVSALAAPGWQSAATFVVAFEERGQVRHWNGGSSPNRPRSNPSRRPRNSRNGLAGCVATPAGGCSSGLALGPLRPCPARRGPPPRQNPAPRRPTQGRLPRKSRARRRRAPAEASTAETRAAKTPAAGTPAALDIERADLADSRGSTELVAGSARCPGTVSSGTSRRS